MVTIKLLEKSLLDIYDSLEIKTFLDTKNIQFNQLKLCDLIIIDEIMEKNTGTEIIASIIKDISNDDSPAVLFMSSLSEYEIQRRICKLKLDKQLLLYNIIRKPIVIEELKDMITNMCDKFYKSINYDSTITPTKKQCLFASLNAVIS